MRQATRVMRQDITFTAGSHAPARCLQRRQSPLFEEAVRLAGR